MIGQLAAVVPAFIVLGVVGIVTARVQAGRVLVYGGSLVLCAVLLGGGLAALTGDIQRIVLPIGIPWVGGHLRLDALSGFFLALIGLGGGGASLFALGYGQSEHHPGRVLPFFPAFLAGMTLVILADDAFLFLFGWELMSLSSWALVMAHQDEATAPSAPQPGYVYLLMATFSGLTLLLAFGLLAGAGGGLAFDNMRLHAAGPGVTAGAFVLALIGAGSKAGLVPLHVWLPLAHPAAPSHVSALMSGVMTKVAVYGFVRIVFDLLAPQPWWTATLVLVAGGITAVLGVLQAVLERDLKRLLAYSTVENIGIIFVGLGMALAFRLNGFAAGAALAITAALFHAFNHTLFKSLLFFGAGAVLNATGRRDMETMGGLIHRMPVTAFFFLAGCMAVSALPPLNGFASEWLTFQAVLLRPQLPQWGLKLMFPVDGALLALAAALAAACFVRAYGAAFLGRPRTPAAEQATEVDHWSLTAMGGFALLCLLAGIFPGAVIDALAPVSQAMTGARMPVQLADPWLTIAPIAASRSSYNGLLVFSFIAVSMLLTIAAVHRVSRGIRRSPPWDCGFPQAAPDTQYSATSFQQPIRRVFGVIFRVRDSVDMPAPGERRAASITQRRWDPIWDPLYAPIAGLVSWIAERMNVLQFLTIRSYLSFVFGALVVLLLTLALWQ
ncbi:MAG: hydrogenase 4 subunit B [Acetobacteraceae bacterium]|nr:hydrogenase 4 subunit B [Pseudomonadota bacterium]